MSITEDAIYCSTYSGIQMYSGIQSGFLRNAMKAIFLLYEM